MGFEDLTGKAKDLGDKAKDAAKDLGDKAKDTAKDLSDKAKDAVDTAKDAVTSEEKTDKVLDDIAGAANKATGGKFADKIDAARNAADDKLGGK